jgi:hypothetical protein
VDKRWEVRTYNGKTHVLILCGSGREIGMKLGIENKMVQKESLTMG